MSRELFHHLARRGVSIPIAADLVLHEEADPEAVLADGVRLGQVLERTARRFDLPLALPHMDLELEKKWLLSTLGVPTAEQATYHFHAVPDEAIVAQATAGLTGAPIPKLQAHIDSIAYIAQHTDLVPVGMAIGVFSLMTKLLADPITPIAMAGAGMTAEDDEEIALVEVALELSVRTILASLERQLAAGAQVVFIAEPAANKVYLSPNQIEAGSDIFDRYVMAFDQRVKALLAAHGVELFFHCCGELTDYMVRKFTELDPAVLSLGSSRVLWEDAALVPKTTVLFGNLPSKQFYSDGLITQEQVVMQANELRERMAAVAHPFILGSECDILSVPGCEYIINGKVMVLAACGCLR